jgi:hypothetical protein
LALINKQHNKNALRKTIQDQWRQYIAVEAVMVDWLTWPADLVLSAGAIVAGWFVSKDAPSFLAVQMGFALLVLAAVVAGHAS